MSAEHSRLGICGLGGPRSDRRPLTLNPFPHGGGEGTGEHSFLRVLMRKRVCPPPNAENLLAPCSRGRVSWSRSGRDG